MKSQLEIRTGNMGSLLYVRSPLLDRTGKMGEGRNVLLCFPFTIPFSLQMDSFSIFVNITYYSFTLSFSLFLCVCNTYTWYRIQKKKMAIRWKPILPSTLFPDSSACFSVPAWPQEGLGFHLLPAVGPRARLSFSLNTGYLLSKTSVRLPAAWAH